MPVNPSFLRPRVFAQAVTAPAGIVPTDVPGLLAWFKADAGTFQNSDGTTAAAADGDVVGYWGDQSGNGYHATQGTTASKPVLKTGANGINGLPVVLGDGSNDRLATASITHGIGTGNFWWMAVMRPVTVTVPWRGLCANGVSAPSIYYGSTHRFFWTISQPYPGLTAGTAYLLEWGRASGKILHVRNGALNETQPAETSSMANAALSLFDDGGSKYGYVAIGEFLFYANKPSDENLTALRSYLNGRWAVY